MRILVAVAAVDGRKGIDSLARLCQEKLQSDPFSGGLFVFRSRRGTSIRVLVLVYDGQGFSWRRSACRKGDLCGGRVEKNRSGGWKRTRRSYCWRRATRRRPPHRCGGK